ncbi:hypothetical protein QZH41_003234 [Actinostola sp. cb2023]|nr:hypothetical protein QZH41_003234 [Actinostola sp. cb2023]
MVALGSNISRSIVENSTSTNGSTNTPLCLIDDPIVTRVLRVMAYVVIILVSLLGNSMTVIIVAKGPKRRSCVHLFLANMAVADLTITIFYMPRMVVRIFYGSRWLLDGVLGLVSCRLVVFLHHTAILVSVFSVFLITVDRFCAIIFPLKRIMSKRVAKMSILSSWILAAALRSPFLMSPKVVPSSKYKLVCSARFVQFFGDFVSLYRHALAGVYWFCLASTICLYIVIISRLCLKKAPGNATEATSARQRAGRKLLKMLVSITAAYVACWFLYFMAIPIHGSTNLPCDLDFFRYLMAHSNSAINPCLLALFDETYRNGYKTLLKRLCCLPNGNLAADSSNTSVSEMRRNLQKTNSNNDNNSVDNVCLRIDNSKL